MIRLFVGCAAGVDAESQAVLEYTARTLSSQPVEITWMYQARKGFWAGWNCQSWRTPFTGYRWGVPAACDFKGRAIYTDSDFIFRADLAELWDQPMPAPILLRRAEGKLGTSAMLLDCARLKPHLPPIEKLKALPDQDGFVRKYLMAHRELLAPFAGDWNCTDLKGYANLHDPNIKAIHYSRIETQVHLKHAVARLKQRGKKHWYTGAMYPHPRPELSALFDQLLIDAKTAGFSPEVYETDVPRLERRDFKYAQRAPA